ncbi:winged helix DNA-binding domain-containing protein [Georgenia sp. 311]|uniref:Winged helix DNA-binding domain-containing protein n=1 Tax=Georgenia wutianyii TaxID=2585135 RepID=A0ABX5VQ39_9MICO|nr:MULTISPECIES: winged helix DNA-binding domain-containing protein [Georgenia]QDB79781.1 winged helix DNA-binding domain-containing protein [Georgenia wutianyii]TNC18105.1 winged helix DNA-binding domain-containing protein [Georgenia sp. 311]
MLTDRDVARWRLATQRLVAPHHGSVLDVVTGLLAVQAENRGQSGWSVASRTSGRTAGELDELLAEGAVVRTHVLRPTWHYVAAADVDWLLRLTAPRNRPVFERQLADLGLTSAVLDRAGVVVLEHLATEPDRDRTELAAVVAAHGIALTGHAFMLFLGLLELDRLIVSGRERGTTHTYARYADRVVAPSRFDREEALAELAWRYLGGHGPATERDLAYWATLTLTDARRAIAASRHRLASFEHDGRTFWHDPAGAPPSGEEQEPAGHLLLLLDEIYRGYQDSRMVLDVAGIVPRGRETAIGIALVGGQIVGSMRRTLGSTVRFDVEAYRPLGPVELAALEAAAARYASYLDLPPVLTVRS